MLNIVGFACIASELKLFDSQSLMLLHWLQCTTARNGIHIPLPITAKSTKIIISQAAKELYTQRLMTYYLPETFFGLQPNDKIYICAYRTIIDPSVIIAECLVNVEGPSLFHLTPQIVYEANDTDNILNQENCRIFAGPSTN